MLNYNLNILSTNRQKIPFWKVDIVDFLNVLSLSKPRKTKISGLLCLKPLLITENHPRN